MIQLFIKESHQNNQRLTVRDNRGQILYIIEGRWGRKDDLMTLHALGSDQYIKAKQSKLSPLPTFELSTEKEKIGTIRKHPGLFGIRDSYFTVHPLEWIITGDFEELYFTAYYKNDLIMECEKITKNTCNYFELFVTEAEDVPLCSLITALLDHYVRGKQEDLDDTSEITYDLGFLNNIRCSVVYNQENYTKVNL